MRKRIIMLTVLAMAATASADSITADGLTYAPVRIQDLRDGQLVYELHGRVSRVAVRSVTAVQIDALAALGAAEQAAGRGQWAQAIEQYHSALRSAREPWQQALVRVRLASAAQASGRIDLAVEQWLAAIGHDAALAALAPTRPADAGSRENRQAIALLSPAEQRYSDDAARLAGVRTSLLALQRAEGNSQEVARLAGLLGEGDEGGRGGSARQLEAAAALVDAGQPAQAAAQLEQLLRRLEMEELPQGLVLLGRAHLALAAAAGDDQTRRHHALQGGLHCMRAAVFFPSSGQAAEAFYLAGRANQMLGNNHAAANAWRVVVEQYSGTPAASAAQRALGEL